jgi:UDP-glucose-4-epimerase GalE
MPGLYYRNNVVNTLTLLEAMKEVDTEKIIFSSTCSTYGEPDVVPIPEDHPQHPINPYGKTKLIVEQMLADFELAHGIKHVNLRYFNAGGADPDGEIGEHHDPESHLIPLVIEAAMGKRPHIAIFGTDYPTPDGTCIRDYIHVTDLAKAHVLALEHLLGGGSSKSYNLGSTQGNSVREVIDEVQRVSSTDIQIVEARRRPGDPARLIGSSELIRSELGWTPDYSDISSIVETAWRWHTRQR